jgi:hypothetical protein
MGARAFVMSRASWRLTEGGIIGPNVFVPWQRVAGWEFRDPETLAIAMVPSGGRLTVPIIADAHDEAAAVLARKLASKQPVN